jgi:hypothetical protein
MKRSPIVASSLAALVLIPAPAFADCFEPRLGPRNAISLRVPTLFAHGVALNYERFLPLEGSVGAGLSVRKGAVGDYSSTTIAATTEARWWPFGEGPFGCRGRYEMVGLYVGLRLDVATTSLRDRLEDRHVGRGWTIAPSSWLGFRFMFGNVEVTPAAATVLRTELGSGLSRYTTVTFAYDLTVGWMF